MTVMRIATVNGAVLTYDTADVADLRIETPADVHEVGTTKNGAILRELGTNHLELRVTFKDGKCWRWVKEADDADLG